MFCADSMFRAAATVETSTVSYVAERLADLFIDGGLGGPRLDRLEGGNSLKIINAWEPH
jgi:hypothetical protein